MADYEDQNSSEYKDVIWGMVGCILLILGNVYTIYNNIDAIKYNSNIDKNIFLLWYLRKEVITVDKKILMKILKIEYK